MAVKYELLDYALKALVEMLMSEYNAAYDWAMQTVLSSETYKQLLSDETLLNEGDLFLFEMLQKELKEQGVLSAEV